MPRMTWEENKARSREVRDAFWRQGLHELGAALYPAGTVAQNPEYGGISTRTPGEVADGIRGKKDKQENKDMTPAKDNTEPSQLQQHMDQLPEPEVAEPNAPEPEVEPVMERE